MSDTIIAIPSKVKLDMAVKPAKRGVDASKRRTHYVGSIAGGTVRAHVYTPEALESLTVKVKDAEVKDLEHGEQRLTWNDKDSNVFVKAFITLSERGNVEKFKMSF